MQDFTFQVPDLTYPDPTPGSDPITPIPAGT